MSNKIKYGIKNVYYAPVTTNGYETPNALEGAVSLSLSAEGERNVFHADNVEYFVTNVNNGYSGDLEIALINDEFRKAVFGEVADTNNVLIENADGSEAVKFALGFEINGDEKATRFWFYNCTAERSEVTGETKEEGITPSTDTITINCTPRTEDGKVRAKTTDTTTTTVYNGWFSAVYTG